MGDARAWWGMGRAGLWVLGFGRVLGGFWSGGLGFGDAAGWELGLGQGTRCRAVIDRVFQFLRFEGCGDVAIG